MLFYNIMSLYAYLNWRMHINYIENMNELKGEKLMKDNYMYPMYPSPGEDEERVFQAGKMPVGGCPMMNQTMNPMMNPMVSPMMSPMMNPMGGCPFMNPMMNPMVGPMMMNPMMMNPMTVPMMSPMGGCPFLNPSVNYPIEEKRDRV